MDTGSRNTRSLHRAGAALGVAAAVLLLPLPAGAATAAAGAAAPQLSIAIDNGRTSVRSGDTLTYVVTVRNLGTVDAVGLLVSQSMPIGLTFGSADPPATTRSGGVGWVSDLAAGGEVVFRSTATVSDTPTDLFRLASVACAATSADGPPVVCATHSDQLPAGATAEAARPTDATSSTVDRRWYLAGGGALVAATGLALLIRRRVTGRRTRG